MYSVAASRFEQLMYAVTMTTFEENFTLILDRCHLRVRITRMVIDEEVRYFAVRVERNTTIISQDRFALMNNPPPFQWNRISPLLTIDICKKARFAFLGIFSRKFMNLGSHILEALEAVRPCTF